MPKPRQWKRSDFASTDAYRTWKEKGTPKAKPFERAGFSTDYQYRKARKSYKAYVRNTSVYPVPDPTRIRKTVESQKRSQAAGRIDRSIMVPRKASGKAKRYTVYTKATFKEKSKLANDGRNSASAATANAHSKGIVRIVLCAHAPCFGPVYMLVKFVAGRFGIAAAAGKVYGAANDGVGNIVVLNRYIIAGKCVAICKVNNGHK